MQLTLVSRTYPFTLNGDSCTLLVERKQPIEESVVYVINHDKGEVHQNTYLNWLKRFAGRYMEENRVDNPTMGDLRIDKTYYGYRLRLGLFSGVEPEGVCYADLDVRTCDTVFLEWCPIVLEVHNTTRCYANFLQAYFDYTGIDFEGRPYTRVYSVNFRGQEFRILFDEETETISFLAPVFLSLPLDQALRQAITWLFQIPLDEVPHCHEQSCEEYRKFIFEMRDKDITFHNLQDCHFSELCSFGMTVSVRKLLQGQQAFSYTFQNLIQFLVISYLASDHGLMKFNTLTTSPEAKCECDVSDFQALARQLGR